MAPAQTLDLSPLHLPAKPSTNLGDWTSVPQSQWSVCKPQRVPTQPLFCYSGIPCIKKGSETAPHPYIAPIINLIDPAFTVNPLGRAQEQWLRLMKELQGTDVPESQLCDIMTSGLDLQVALQL